MRKKIIVYTANYDNYDRLRSPWVKSDNADYVCFSDEEFTCEDWEVRQIPSHDKDPNRSAKIFKILPEKYFPEYEYSLWVDASRLIAIEPQILIDRYLQHSDIAVYRHPFLHCAYDEAQRCNRLQLDRSALIDAQMAAYKKEGYPKNRGLSENPIILRRHTKNIAELNKLWWLQIETYSKRDQLSLDYSLWKNDIVPKYLPRKLNVIQIFNCYHKASFKSKLPDWLFAIQGTNIIGGFRWRARSVIDKLFPKH